MRHCSLCGRSVAKHDTSTVGLPNGLGRIPRPRLSDPRTAPEKVAGEHSPVPRRGAHDPVPLPAADRADDRIGVQSEWTEATKTSDQVEILEEPIGSVPADRLEDLSTDEDPLVAERAEPRE